MTGLATYVGFAAVALVMLYLDALPFWLLLLIITAMMTMFTWADATLGALSMANLGKIAGTAAIGIWRDPALGATLLGSIIGQCYDGTPRALLWGSFLWGQSRLPQRSAGKSQRQ